MGVIGKERHSVALTCYSCFQGQYTHSFINIILSYFTFVFKLFIYSTLNPPLQNFQWPQTSLHSYQRCTILLFNSFTANTHFLILSRNITIHPSQTLHMAYPDNPYSLATHALCLPPTPCLYRTPSLTCMATLGLHSHVDEDTTFLQNARTCTLYGTVSPPRRLETLTLLDCVLP